MRVELAQARQQMAQPGALQHARVGVKVSTSDSAARSSSQLEALRTRLRATRALPGGLTSAHALRLFVEAALADEWGHQLQLDPAFHDLVERTCKALEADDAQAQLLVAAMQELEALD
jgi:hypothetical protein